MTTKTPIKAKPEHFTTDLGEGRTVPLYEDENASGVYGYGHGDAQAFADAVNDYDRSMGEGDHPYSAGDVEFGWARVYVDEGMTFAWERVDESTEGAFPMMWVNR